MAGRCMKCAHYDICNCDQINSEEVWGGCRYFEDDREKFYREKELFKSFLLRLIHCTDGARYEEDIADDYCALVREMCGEYKEKYGEEVEENVEML